VIACAAACVVLLVSAGMYLLLGGNLQRVVFGFLLLSNGVNLVVLAGTPPAPGAGAPVVGEGPPAVADPLPQAFLLTAIVIGLASALFLLALAVRNHRQTGSDRLGGAPPRDRG
jgi:multicomponent Na+:H+ antiporter subunit C